MLRLPVAALAPRSTRALMVASYDDMEFVKKVEERALVCGYRPIELCWMTWLVQPDGKKMRMEKYSNILSKM